MYKMQISAQATAILSLISGNAWDTHHTEGENFPFVIIGSKQDLFAVCLICQMHHATNF